MKEYKYLRTFADSSFEPEVNGLVRQGWKVIHFEWLIPEIAVFLERDINYDELHPEEMQQNQKNVHNPN